METATATRPSPKPILVPPPDGPAIPRQRIIGILVWCALVFLGVIILGLTVGGLPAYIWVSIWPVLWLLVFVGLWVVSRRATRNLRAARQLFFEKHPATATDHVAVKLGHLWEPYDRVPKIDAVRETLGELADQLPADRARIICFGEPDLPDVGEFHFEPEIISPTGSVWRQLHWIVIAGALLVLWLSEFLGLLPGWFPSIRAFLGGFSYFLVAGLVVLGAWIWKAWIRPTYIRMAPGIIQVLEFRNSRSNPTIRSYPIEPATLVYVTRIRKHFVLTLARDDQKTSLHISQMQNPQQRIAQTWQALLSTAPTPPLSDDALVG